MTRLARRELEILNLAAKGLGDKQIALELGISKGTLTTYWARIRAKLGCSSRAAMVAQLIREEAAVRTRESFDAASEFVRNAHPSSAVLRLDSRNVVTQASAACEAICGHTPSQIVGHTIDELAQAENAKTGWIEHVDLVRSSNSVQVAWMAIPRGRATARIRCQSLPDFSQFNPGGVWSFITEVDEYEFNFANRFTPVLSVSTDVAIVFEACGRIVSMNAGAMAAIHDIGFPRDERPENIREFLCPGSIRFFYDVAMPFAEAQGAFQYDAHLRVSNRRALLNATLMSFTNNFGKVELFGIYARGRREPNVGNNN